MVILTVCVVLNLVVNAIHIGLQLADKRPVQSEYRAVKRERAKEERPDELEERRLRELEKAWQEGLSNILSYNLEAAGKAGRADGR